MNMEDSRSEAASGAAVFEGLLHSRHSCRAFQPEALPRAIVERILSIAQRTPSWCNTQPWEVSIVSGAPLEELRHRYSEKARAGERAPDLVFPIEYRCKYLDRRRACGAALYASLGIPREDKDGAREQLLQNFTFFGAPHLAVVTTDPDLGDYGAIDCGAYISMFLLAAESLGVASVPQAAVATNSVFMREFLSIPARRKVVAGISFGWERKGHPANGFRTERASIDDVVRWIG